jgi:uncharacterized protein YqhQ
MRSPNAYAVSVRRPDGTIAGVSGLLAPPKGHPVLTRPVIRGVAVLLQSLALGASALDFSAAVARRREQGVGELRVGRASVPFTAAVLAANLGVLLLVPFAVTHVAIGSVEAGEPTARSLAVESVVRVVLILAVVFGLSRVPTARRLFEYHGAEHKAIIAYESGRALTVEAVRAQRRQHVLCGTSFLTVAVLVATALFPALRHESFAGGLLVRALLIPIVAGVSYELIRAAARGRAGRMLRPLMLPGIWLQHVTTREPLDDQIEVAIHALEASLALEARCQPAAELR